MGEKIKLTEIISDCYEMHGEKPTTKDGTEFLWRNYWMAIGALTALVEVFNARADGEGKD